MPPWCIKGSSFSGTSMGRSNAADRGSNLSQRPSNGGGDEVYYPVSIGRKLELCASSGSSQSIRQLRNL
jgi:hypothetical protein